MRVKQENSGSLQERLNPKKVAGRVSLKMSPLSPQGEYSVVLHSARKDDLRQYDRLFLFFKKDFFIPRDLEIPEFSPEHREEILLP